MLNEAKHEVNMKLNKMNRVFYFNGLKKLITDQFLCLFNDVFGYCAQWNHCLSFFKEEVEEMEQQFVSICCKRVTRQL